MPHTCTNFGGPAEPTIVEYYEYAVIIVILPKSTAVPYLYGVKLKYMIQISRKKAEPLKKRKNYTIYSL